MVRFLRSAGVLVVMALLLASCSKSSSTSPQTAPTLKAPTFSGPSSTSSTADTSMGYYYATTYASVFTAYSSGFMGFFQGTGTQSGNSWNWSYTANGITGTWTATSSSSGYNWSLVLNGSNTSASYNHWTALSGSESTDGSTGNWSLYYENTTNKQWDVSWSTSGTVVTGTILAYDSTGAVVQKDVITNNADKSGELKEWVGNGTQMTWDIVWNANGSGHYTEWDDKGNVVASGSWS